MLGPPISLVGYVVVIWNEPTGLPGSMEALLSWPYAASCVLGGAGVAAAVTGAVAPRLAAAGMAVGPIVAAWSDAGMLELTIAVVWGLILLIDVTFRARQSAVIDHLGGPSGERVAERPRWIGPGRALVTAAAVVMLAFCVSKWTERRLDLLELDDRAAPAMGVLRGVQGDVAQIDVSGKVYDFYDPSFLSLEEGAEVPVLTDPEGRERPWGPEDADPDSWSDWMALAGAVLLVLVIVVGVRVYRLARLAAGGRSVRARIVLDGDAGSLTLVPCDDDQPVAVLAALELPGSGGRVDAYDLWWVDSEGGFKDDCFGGEGCCEGIAGDSAEPMDVVVHGLSRYGDPVIIEVQEQDGPIAVVAALRVVEPRTVRGLWRRWADRGMRGAEQIASSHVGRTMVQASRRPALRWLIVPVACLGGLLGQWIWGTSSDDLASSWLAVVMVAHLFGGIAHAIWSYFAPPVRLVGGDVVIAGRVRDQVVDLGSIEGVRARRDYIALDVRGQANSIPIHPDFDTDAQLEALRSVIAHAVAGHRAPPSEPAIYRRWGPSAVAALVTPLPFVVVSLIVTRAQMPLIDWSLLF